jgi:hypothetical protein
MPTPHVPSTPQPPPLASWLVDLFTPYDQAESIPGDLHEEFSNVASQYGILRARHWYWRQSFNSIAHLFAAAFRASPLSISGSVITGFLLLGWSAFFPERIEFAIFNWDHMYHANWYARVSWMRTMDIVIGHLLSCLLIGSIVALLAKGKELVAIFTLISLQILRAAVLLRFARYVTPFPHPEILPTVLFMIEYPIMLLLGAWIVRDARQTKSRTQSHP